MKVLFVSSGNVDCGISPIVTNQGDSLVSEGVIIEYFLVRGKGVWSYLKSYFVLRSFLNKNFFDIVHAHYSYCGYLVGLTFNRRKTVVSLMGSDVNKRGVELVLIKIFSAFFWGVTIVKTERMKSHFKNKKMVILPNGVNFDIFKPLQKENCQKEVGFNSLKKHIIFFLSNPSRTEKNLPLAMEAIQLLSNDSVEFHTISLVQKERIPFLLNASDVLLLTSFFEGSPNIIKEAMACNIPIVTTDVGDVRTTIGDTEGCFITSYKPTDVKGCLEKALNYSKRTNGRSYIDFLDSKVIAKNLIKIYKELIGNI